MLRSKPILVSVLVMFGTAGAKEGMDSNLETIHAVERAKDWLRNGDIVSQTYSIDEAGMRGPVRFALTLDDGMLLAGCWNGAFLFDGSQWSQVPDIPRARSWLRRRDGRLLIGAAGAIYEMKRDAQGAYAHLPVKNLANIETVFDYMTELSDGRLAVLYGKGVMIEQADGSMKSFPLGTWTRGLVHIESGIYLTVNNHDYHLCQLDPATGAVRDVEERFREILGSRHIVELLPRDAGTCWVITMDGHTYVFDGTSLTPAPWQKTGSCVLIVPTCILQQKDGTLVVGSVDEGVFFISTGGEILHRLNSENGLPEATAVALCLDADDGLWVATSRHLTRVDAQCRFLSFGGKQGLKIQDCEAVTRHRGKLYVAGEEGLFEQNLDARRPSEAFRRVEGIFTARGLTSDGETLWAGGNRLVGLQPDGGIKLYDTGSITSILVPSDNRNRLVCSTTDGFVILDRLTGGWQISKKISLGGPSTFELLEFTPGEYWATCGTGLVARLRVRDADYEVKLLGPAEGVPDFWTVLTVFEGHLYLAGDPGVIDRWDENAGQFRPCEDFTYYQGNIGLPLWMYTWEFADRVGNVWVMNSIRNGLLVRKPSTIVGAPLQIVAKGEVLLGRGLFVENDGSAWICHVGGVLHCSDTNAPTPRPRSRLVVRQISDLRTGATLAGMIRKGGSLALAPAQNSIRVTAAFLDLRAGRYSKFKIWVDGIEKMPETWSQESMRDLTNLPSGTFVLHVKSRDGIGLQYQSLDVRLTIATPWYRTPLAIVCYAIVGLLFVGLLIRLREMRLRWSNRQLARAVEEGRREIEVKHRELQSLLVKTESFAHDLAMANSALEKSTQGKTEFVRTISHELRNPIAGARMTAELLCRSELGAASQRQAANLRNCVNYLQTLLDETLDLTQVESGHIGVKLEQFSTAVLLREVAGIFENIAKEKNLGFEVIPGPNPDALLFGDKTHSKRILVNYLSNAFKYTLHGKVVLRAEPASLETDLCRIRFEVLDTGPGVSETIQGRLFTEFVRESSHTETDSMPGAGLGLALCKQLAGLCGGSVGFSTKVGKGSQFWVELPFINPRKGELIPTETTDSRPDFSDLQVCVIDDDPLQLEAMSAALEEFGVVPANARTAGQALELLRTKRFGVIIMDYHIGQETGIQLLLKAKGQSVPPFGPAKAHCHLITALWDENLPQKAREAGFEGAHKKPLSLVALFQILQAARGA
jgi:signal transduction histidine kinase/CheY-like chemotaxis protein